ncbi:hypothetical protein, partial [Klebsiella pneumoniae]|uniref:hypothetical protein n=1 Tax=Klebsiella pneumoniae TaxID=573 RepID=UPI003F5113C5
MQRTRRHPLRRIEFTGIKKQVSPGTNGSKLRLQKTAPCRLESEKKEFIPGGQCHTRKHARR